MLKILLSLQFIRSCNWIVLYLRYFLGLIHAPGTTAGEDIFWEAGNLNEKNKNFHLTDLYALRILPFIL